MIDNDDNKKLNTKNNIMLVTDNDDCDCDDVNVDDDDDDDNDIDDNDDVVVVSLRCYIVAAFINCTCESQAVNQAVLILTRLRCCCLVWWLCSVTLLAIPIAF